MILAFLWKEIPGLLSHAPPWEIRATEDKQWIRTHALSRGIVLLIGDLNQLIRRLTVWQKEC